MDSCSHVTPEATGLMSRREIRSRCRAREPHFTARASVSGLVRGGARARSSRRRTFPVGHIATFRVVVVRRFDIGPLDRRVAW